MQSLSGSKMKYCFLSFCIDISEYKGSTKDTCILLVISKGIYGPTKNATYSHLSVSA